MSHEGERLDRLLRAASRVPTGSVQAPAGFADAVVDRALATRRVRQAWSLPEVWALRGLGAAAATMIAAAAWAYPTLVNSDPYSSEDPALSVDVVTSWIDNS